MASIIRKRIRGHAYYYARECRRVDGKPKIVWQMYLGKVEDLIARAGGPPPESVAPPPLQARITDFGAVAALYDLARRLDLEALIDRHVPKRGKGPGVGAYLVAAVVNRAVAPCSKAALADWFAGTALCRLMALEPAQLTSQRFWDNMDRVTPEAIKAVEAELARTLVERFDLDVSRVLFDATNFFTFIDTFNGRCDLARRGHSKEGRAALRIVGLALLVTADFHVPLLHHTYPGNQTDAPTFASLTDALVERYRQLCDGAQHVTLVFDKGNNSKDNLEAVDRSPYHFIGSLVPTQHPDLLATPAERLRPLDEDGLSGVSAFRTRQKVFGAERTVLVTYNENLFVSQARTLLREIHKRQQALRALQEQLRRRRQGRIRGGKAPTVAGTQKQVDGLLHARHMKDLFRVEVTEHDGLPRLTYRFDAPAWQRLQDTLLGKTLLFTDNDAWTDAEIVRGYRSQHHVEAAFRCLKDPAHLALRPQFHWTDQKIRVHVFCCVLALTLCSLLQRELHRTDLDHSIPHLLDTLGRIQEVTLVYPPREAMGTPTLQTTLSEMDDEQRRLYDALDLQRYRAG